SKADAPVATSRLKATRPKVVRIEALPMSGRNPASRGSMIRPKPVFTCRDHAPATVPRLDSCSQWRHHLFNTKRGNAMTCPNRDAHRRAITLAAILAVVLGATDHARAQTWPSHTVSVIIPFTAGNANDVVARIVLTSCRVRSASRS